MVSPAPRATPTKRVYRLVQQSLVRKTRAAPRSHSSKERTLPACFVRHLAGQISLLDRLPHRTRQMRVLPLTALTQQITITNEYRTRPRGDTSHSKSHAKARSRKANGTFESSPNYRAARLARWFQDRYRSSQKSRLISAQRCR